MVAKTKLVPQNPLILRNHRLMEAFAKSDDERDFYLDRYEGFLLYVDLDKGQEELEELEKELHNNPERYCPIPKLTFYEIKKLMEGFVNEKVYDIDTKEKLLDIIQSKEARENFLEFIYDHHSELEKWQQYYQERFRVRIIEWLRNNNLDFVFEEDLELTKSLVEKLKMNIFVPKAAKDIVAARKMLVAKAKTYYSNEALNPRPKRGRPPKQVAKVETEPQFSEDIYISVSKAVKSFLFAPDYHSSSAIFTFSGKFASEADLLAHRRQQLQGNLNIDLHNLNQKLAALKSLSSTWQVSTKEQPIHGETPLWNSSHELSKNGVEVLKTSKKSVSLDEGAPSLKASSTLKPSKETSPKPFPQKKSLAAVTKAKEKKPLKKAAAKAVAKKPVVKAKKAPQKMRLRPLPKRGSKAQSPQPKEKSAKKGKNSQLRMLRRAKKR